MTPSSNENKTERPEVSSGRSLFSTRARRRAKFYDRLATMVIRFGGISVVFCVIGILLLIISEALPLFFEGRAQVVTEIPSVLSSEKIRGVGLDEMTETAYWLTESGQVSYLNLKEGKLSNTLTLPNKQQKITSAYTQDYQHWVIQWANGQTSKYLIQSGFRFDETGKRVANQFAKELVTFSSQSNLQQAQIGSDEGMFTRASLLKSGSLKCQWLTEEENFLGEVTREWVEREVVSDKPLTMISLNSEGTTLVGATQEGILYFWRLRSGDAKLESTVELKVPVTQMSWLMGGGSLVCGTEDGQLKVLFSILDAAAANGKRYVVAHNLLRRQGSIRQIISSPRYRAAMSLDATGLAAFDYATTETRLLDLTLEGFSQASFNSRGNGFIALDSTASQIKVWKLELPHPEMDAKALFSQVWYESYPRPEYVWQSSSGSNDFEPKLSLIPLVFGTLKGAFYAMIFAVPLALMGAIYTSQFASEWFRSKIKPTLELLGAVPTVVIGFLAALWLAPRLDANLISVLSGFLVLPVCVLLGIFIWSYIRQFGHFERLEKTREWLLILPGIGLGILIAALLGPWIEQTWFFGDFKLWLFESAGHSYDPRNCLGVSLALGFAVLPTIFTLAEDALSSVPTPLSAASLALGASRWQTVFHVLLPSASSGILAALILGLGRAIGETMIVLMATGNTPIIDMSPFNGMRTLSANIAVEIPEAPVDGTLYRVLFLSAVILFIFTSVLNTATEWFRHRLKKKLGSEA